MFVSCNIEVQRNQCCGAFYEAAPVITVVLWVAPALAKLKKGYSLYRKKITVNGVYFTKYSTVIRLRAVASFYQSNSTHTHSLNMVILQSICRIC